MQSLLLFLLLLCFTPADGQGRSEAFVPEMDPDWTWGASPAPPALPVLWDELQGLKDLVLSLKAVQVEQRQALRGVQTRLRDGELEAERQRRSVDALQETAGRQTRSVDALQEAAVQQGEQLSSTAARTEADRKLLTELSSDLRRTQRELEEQSRVRDVEFWSQMSAMRVRLNHSETSLDHLQEKNSALETRMLFLQTRLRASENTVEQLRRKSSVLALRLCHTESLMEELRIQTSAFPASNSSSEAEASENAHTRALSRLNSSSERQELRFIQALEVRLSDGEKQLEHLKKENSVQSHQLSLMESRLTDGHNTTTALEVRLRSTQTQLEQLENHAAALEVRLGDGEEQLEHLKTENSELEVRLSDGEKQLEHLKTENSVQSEQLSSLESRMNITHNTTVFSSELEVRLSDGEKQLEHLKKENSALEVRLSDGEKQLEHLKTENSALEVRLSDGEKQLEHLKTENSVQSEQLSSLESRLNITHRNTTVFSSELEVRLSDGEKQLEHLKKENSVQSYQLSLMESRLTDGHNTTTALEVRLRSTQTQLEQLENHAAALEVRLGDGEKQLEHLKTENSELEVRLSDGEKQLEHLKTENSVQSHQLSLMESRLTDGHNTTTELEVRLRAGEKQLEDLKTENSVFSVRLNETDEILKQLKNINSGDLKVAFSAGLTDSGSVGPFNIETTLVFSKTMSNIGQAYNQTAGVFTAPVRGLYFFSFTAADYLKGYMGLYLYRNNQPILFNLDLNDHGGYASTSNAVALQLEGGDQVRLSLPASYRLYDDSRNFSVFSGFLLFAL